MNDTRTFECIRRHGRHKPCDESEPLWWKDNLKEVKRMDGETSRQSASCILIWKVCSRVDGLMTQQKVVKQDMVLNAKYVRQSLEREFWRKFSEFINSSSLTHLRGSKGLKNLERESSSFQILWFLIFYWSLRRNSWIPSRREKLLKQILHSSPAQAQQAQHTSLRR